MKVIIPVAGIGKRLKPHTYSQPKVLMHVAGKPILGHILDEIQKLKLREVIFITGQMGDMIKKYVDKNYHFKSHFVEQEEQLGLGHAIYLARTHMDSEPVLIILGDTVFHADFKKVLRDKKSAIGVKAVSDPRRFGVVQVGKGGSIRRLIEKSERPPSNLAIVGIYYIQNSALLFSSLHHVVTENVKTAGEYQLTDALQHMVKKGEKMKTFLVDGWYDCGKPETLLSTNRVLLEKHYKKNVPHRHGSIVAPPSFIGKGTIIENSCIGPYVSVANGCTVKNAVLKNCIINENARVENVLLDDSIIGANAMIVGRFERINLGDSSEVDLAYRG